jgi:hypothetical protein
MTDILLHWILVTQELTQKRTLQVDALLGNNWSTDLLLNVTNRKLYARVYCTEQQATMIRLLL